MKKSSNIQNIHLLHHNAFELSQENEKKIASTFEKKRRGALISPTTQLAGEFLYLEKAHFSDF